MPLCHAALSASPMSKSTDMSKGLFVTFEGLPPTIADSQVVEHIRDMRRRGIDIDVWAFAAKASIYRESKMRLIPLSRALGGHIRLFRAVPVVVPGSELLNALLFAVIFWKHGSDVHFVHARTDYSAVVCSVTKLLRKVVLIWDCRGDATAEYLSAYSQTTRLRCAARPVQWAILELRAKLAALFCDKALFVSEMLRKRRVPRRFAKPYEIIPCAASQELFYFSPVLRAEYRAKLSLQNDERVIVYSGSMNGYQVFDKCVNLFVGLSKADSALRLVVLTPYPSLAQRHLKELPAEQYKLISVPMAEVNGYLNAADFALFLRERNDVNIVASPVKFAEYCLTGLRIIMTDAVEQSYKYATALGNAIVYDFHSLPQHMTHDSTLERERIAQSAVRLLGREAVIGKYMNLYSVS